MPTIHDSYESIEPVDYDATKQANADRLALAGPAMLAVCSAKELILGGNYHQVGFFLYLKRANDGSLLKRLP